MGKKNLTELLGPPRGKIEKIYWDWCINHPEIMSKFFDTTLHTKENVSELQMQFLQSFHQESPNVIKTLLEKCDLSSKKSDEASRTFREEGNKCYQNKQYKAALESYNKAICHAEDPSVLALAYANRSAVQLSLEEFKACIADIDLALESNYPKHLAYKLYQRKGKCYLKLMAFQEAVKSFEKALEFGKLYMEGEKSTLVKEVTSSLEFCLKKASLPNFQSEEKDDDDQSLGFTNNECNPQMPSLSKSVKIAFTSKRGRHGIATRRIECGQVVLVEKSDFNFTALNFRGKVCTHCQQPSLGMIPSHLSTQDMFCSKKCLSLAIDSYHAKESVILDCLCEAELAQTEWHVALKAILNQPLSFFLNPENAFLWDHNPLYGLNLEDVYSSSCYKSLVNLSTCKEAWPLERLHFQAFVAYFYLKCLQKAGLVLIAHQGSCLANEELMIAKLLMHLMNVSSTNCQEINLLHDAFDQPYPMDGVVVPVGGAIFPTLAFFNHNCDPNTLAIQKGNCVMLIANRTIQEGDEVAITYGQSYADSSMGERQAYLKERYFFECDCMPCLKAWPTMEAIPKCLNDMEENQLKMDASNKDSFMKQMALIQKLGSSISQEQKSGNYKKAFNFCIQFIKLMEETIDRPHSYYLIAETTMCKVGWILHGAKMKV